MARGIGSIGLAALGLAAGLAAVGCARPSGRVSRAIPPARPTAPTGVPQLPRCARPLGTVTLAAPSTGAAGALSDLGLDSPVVPLRLMVAQSNCFAEKGSRPVVPPEYVLAPSVTAASGTGEGGMSIQEAQSSLVLSEAQSGAEVGASRGSAHVRDFGGGGGLGGFGGGVAGLAGIRGYGNTPEGKLVAASLLDAYSKLIAQLQARTPAAAPMSRGGRSAPP